MEEHGSKKPLTGVGSYQMLYRKVGCRILALLLCVYLLGCTRQPVTVKVVKEVAGGSYSVALTASGEVFTWGTDHRGNLGIGIPPHPEAPVYQLVPVRVSLPSPVLDVFAGPDSAFAITRTGELYAWGANARGELGDGTFVDRPSPVRVKLEERVTQVASGVGHTVAIAASGTVYTWGSNEFGSVGNGRAENQPIPARLDLGESVRKVAAGGGHCLALTHTGKVHAWGANNCGQVGTDDAFVSRPVSVMLEAHVKDIATGLTFSIVLTEGGDVFSSGSNTYGELGNGATKDSKNPGQVSFAERIVAVAAGWSHAFALSESGILYGWGWGKFGQVGVGTRTDTLLPTPLNLPSVALTSHISAGDAHTFLVCDTDTIYGWGGNKVGQLGDDTQLDRLTPVRLPFLTIRKL